jgi:hypothetical protein
MHFLVLAKWRHEHPALYHNTSDLGRSIHECLLLMVPKSDLMDHAANLPNIAAWHTTSGDSDVIDVNGEFVTARPAEAINSLPQVVISKVSEDRAQRAPGWQMPLITRELSEKSSQVSLAPHYLVEEPKNPPLWGAGEKFLNVQTLYHSIVAMDCGIGHVASTFYGAEEKVRRFHSA